MYIVPKVRKLRQKLKWLFRRRQGLSKIAAPLPSS